MLLNKRIPVSYILNKIRYPLISMTLLSLLVLYLTSRFQGSLPDMPLSIPAFIGTAISVLLSFKLSQSYDRWWEARKIWGCIVNDSRSLVLQLLTLTADKNDPLIRKIALRQVGWAYALGRALRGLDPLDTIDAFIDEEELKHLKDRPNKPLAMLYLHGADIRKLRDKGAFDTFTHLQIDDTLVRLCDAQGKAERIKSTVFPVTYRLFLHFMIYVFMVTLSISLRNVMWYFETPLLLVISMTFFLLEKSATHMQDPFENRPTDTAVTAIARTIEINIKDLVNEPELPEPHPVRHFYIN